MPLLSPPMTSTAAQIHYRWFQCQAGNGFSSLHAPPQAFRNTIVYTLVSIPPAVWEDRVVAFSWIVSCDPSVALHQLHCVSCTASDALHQLHCISCTTSLALHQLHCISCTTSVEIHQLHCINRTASIGRYQLHCINCTAF